MSQSNRPPGGEGGSIRQARELMEAGGLQSDRSPPGQRVVDAERNAETESPPHPRQPMHAALSASRTDGQGIGMAISRPTQVPWWPSAAPVQGSSSQTSNAQFQTGRGQIPQRPPRPSKSKIPSMLDTSKLQEHMHTFQYKPQPQAAQLGGAGVSLTSPNTKSPMTPASRSSTASSAGSIPDFPMPVTGPTDHSGPTGPARKSTNLGPPPTARRGASSYYSTASYVSPIQEESPRMQSTHGSYASSAAMPATWRDDSSDYLDDDSSAERNLFAGETIPEEGRDSRQSNGDDGSERELVRSASIGRRGKPSMVETKSVEKATAAPTYPTLANPKMGAFGPMDMRVAQMKAAAAAYANASSGRPNPVSAQIGNADSPLVGGTSPIENLSSESTSTLARATTPRDVDDEKPPLPSETDPRISQIIHAHQAASGVITADEKELERSFSRRSARRRPPKLDINAARDQEVRGSLTSLPDLIKRATRLAAMIDNGKRPGSRLNILNDFSDADLAREKEEGEARRPQSGLSGMLAAFPPPGLATPRQNSPRPQRSGDGSTNALNPNGPSGRKPGRRCCWLPHWLFLLIALATLLIIAAAVLVPLFLFVINKSSDSSNTQPQLAQCQQTTPCANGGTSILTSNACSCICVNGFTGSTCTTASSGGCTMSNISGSNGTIYTNVTLGEAIPRLISAAKTNFSIPLSSDIILGRFNSANLSCNAENALVTFDGVDLRQDSGESPVSSSSSSTPTATAKAKVRRDVTSSSTSYATTTSVNPTIIIDTSAVSTTNSAGASTIPSGTTTVTGTSPSSTASFTITQETLDFARVVTLYILQMKDLDDAVTAQTYIQTFFNRPQGEGNITLGNGNSVDFWEWAVDVGQGMVGGKTAAAGRRWIGRGLALPVQGRRGN